MEEQKQVQIKVRQDLEALLKPLPKDAYEALKQDIAERGIQVPIVIDQEGNILDGHNRYRAALELGIEVPYVVVNVGDEEERIERAIALNANRRQLTRSQIKAVAKKLRERGWTQARIAKTLGVTQPFISKLLREDEVREQVQQQVSQDKDKQVDKRWVIEFQQRLLMLSNQLNIPIFCAAFNWPDEEGCKVIVLKPEGMGLENVVELLASSSSVAVTIRQRKLPSGKVSYIVSVNNDELELTEAQLAIKLIELFSQT